MRLQCNISLLLERMVTRRHVKFTGVELAAPVQKAAAGPVKKVVAGRSGGEAGGRRGGERGVVERKAGKAQWRGSAVERRRAGGTLEKAGGMRGGARLRARGASVSFFKKTKR
jgi:hypothetical protein